MIDHVSIPVSNLSKSAEFYESVLQPLGLRRLVDRENTIGFGKKYPEFWLNARANTPPIPDDTACHVCLRAPAKEAVISFHERAYHREFSHGHLLNKISYMLIPLAQGNMYKHNTNH